jgi:hypothetical protein
MIVWADLPRLGGWFRYPAIVLCCVLSVTAPCDLTSVGQWLDGSLNSAAVGLGFAEVVESIDESEHLLRVAGPGDSYRLERRSATAQPLAFLPRDEHSLWVPPLNQPADLSAHRPGCEHAFRNGCGSYLLC